MFRYLQRSAPIVLCEKMSYQWNQAFAVCVKYTEPLFSFEHWKQWTQSRSLFICKIYWQMEQWNWGLKEEMNRDCEHRIAKDLMRRRTEAGVKSNMTTKGEEPKSVRHFKRRKQWQQWRGTIKTKTEEQQRELEKTLRRVHVCVTFTHTHSHKHFAHPWFLLHHLKSFNLFLFSLVASGFNLLRISFSIWATKLSTKLYSALWSRS